MLISWWKHSQPAEDFFLRSLASIDRAYPKVDIQVVGLYTSTSCPSAVSPAATFYSAGKKHYSPRDVARDVVTNTHTNIRLYNISRIYDEIRSALVNHRIKVRMLISWWKHSQPAEDFFLRSLASIDRAYPKVDIQVVRLYTSRRRDRARSPP
ncbi:PLD-like domain-containing protein [Phthorimaea operculella]|nr:PLD-like domain-containing protein [Phthorimaea operculella]